MGVLQHVRLAKKFEALVRADDHFEIVGKFCSAVTLIVEIVECKRQFLDG